MNVSFGTHVRDIQRHWAEAGLVGKCFIAICVFITVSSVASLADHIVAWKGFIAEGVEFYRASFVKPVRSSLEAIGIGISDVETDVIAVSSMIAFSANRVLKQGGGAYRRWYLAIAAQAILQIWFFGWAPDYAAVGLLFWIFFLVALCLFVLARFAQLRPQIGLTPLLAFVAPLLYSVILVLILGAISSALSR